MKKRLFQYCEQLNNGRKNEKKGRLVDWFFIQYVPFIGLVAPNTHVLTYQMFLFRSIRFYSYITNDRTKYEWEGDTAMAIAHMEKKNELWKITFYRERNLLFPTVFVLNSHWEVQPEENDSKQRTKWARERETHTSTTTTIMYLYWYEKRWGGNYFKLLNWREFCLFILLCANV